MSSQIPTLVELAEEALAIQDTCNLAGIVTTFSDRIMAIKQRVAEHTGDHSSDTFCRHPIVILWLDKFNSLAGNPDYEQVSDAYQEVMSLCQKSLTNSN